MATSSKIPSHATLQKSPQTGFTIIIRSVTFGDLHSHKDWSPLVCITHRFWYRFCFCHCTQAFYYTLLYSYTYLWGSCEYLSTDFLFKVFLSLTVTGFDCCTVRKWTLVRFLPARLAAGDPHHHFCWLLLQLMPNRGYVNKLWFQQTRLVFIFADRRNVSWTSQPWTESTAFLTKQYIMGRFGSCCKQTPPLPQYVNYCSKQLSDSEALLHPDGDGMNTV